jgi:hypothetical protein
VEKKTKLISMEDRQTNNLLSRGLARLPVKISRSSEDAIYGLRDSRARIFKRLWSPGINSEESILPGWESIPGLLKRIANTGSGIGAFRI